MITAEIEIVTETCGENNWAFTVQVFGGGKIHKYIATLSFSDYELWSHGRVGPSRVVYAAFEFLLQRELPESILSKFDCSVIRRYFPDVDKKLPTMF